MCIRSFCNTPEEWHSLVIGFCQAANPLARAIPPGTLARNMVQGEYWYYQFGRALGGIALVASLLGLARLGVWLLT